MSMSSPFLEGGVAFSMAVAMAAVDDALALVLDLDWLA
jgi:hypothetical protein